MREDFTSKMGGIGKKTVLHIHSYSAESKNGATIQANPMQWPSALGSSAAGQGAAMHFRQDQLIGYTGTTRKAIFANGPKTFFLAGERTSAKQKPAKIDDFYRRTLAPPAKITFQVGIYIFAGANLPA